MIKMFRSPGMGRLERCVWGGGEGGKGGGGGEWECRVVDE